MQVVHLTWASAFSKICSYIYQYLEKNISIMYQLYYKYICVHLASPQKIISMMTAQTNMIVTNDK